MPRRVSGHIKFLWVAMIALVCVCATGWTGEEATADKAPATDAKPEAAKAVYEGVLPADVVVHVVTSPTETALKNLEDYLLACIKGAPVPLQPGMLAIMLPRVTQLPAGSLDMTRPIEFVVCNDGSLGLILPTTNFGQQINDLQAAGRATLQPNGVYMVNSPHGAPSYMFDLGDRGVISSPKPEHPQHIAPIMRAWDEDKPSGKATFTVTIDVGKLVAMNEKLIDEAFAKAVKEVQDDLFENEDALPVAKEAAALLPMLFDDTKAIMAQMKSVRIYAYAREDVMTVSGYITPLPDTGLATFAKSYHEIEPSYELYKYLPQGAALTQCAMTSEKAFAPLKDPSAEWVRRLVALVDPPLAPEAADIIRRAFGNVNGESAIAFLLQEGQTIPTTITYLKPEDAENHKKTLKEVWGMLPSLVESVYAIMPEPLPVKLEVKYIENAGTVAGVPYGKLDMKLAEGDPEAVAEMPENARQIIDNLAESIAAYSQLHAYTDGVLVTIGGPDSVKQLEQAVVALRDKTIGAGNDKLLAESLNQVKDKQVMFMSVMLLDLIKMQLLQQSANNPVLFSGLGEAARNLSNSTVPLTLSLGTHLSPAKDGKPATYSLKFLENIPAQAVNETVLAMIQLQMTMMQNQMPPPDMAPPAGVAEPGAAPEADPTF